MELTYFLAAATAVIVTVHGAFDCNRDITQCLNVADDCVLNTGLCNCDALYEGDNCEIEISAKNAVPCVPSTCLNGGTCTGDGATTSVCHCTSDYYDTDCSKERYELTCDGTTGMTLNILPHLKPGAAFAGEIFVKGHQNTAACKFTEVGATGVYTITLTHTGSACGDVTPDGNGVYVREFYMLFMNTIIQLQSDELITTFCGSTDILQKSVTAFTIANIDSNLNLEPVGVFPVDGDVEFELTDTSDGTLPSPIDLGLDIKACARLTPAGLLKFAAIRLEDCKADDNIPSSLEYQLVATQCPVDSPIMLADPDAVGGTPATEICFTFDAFRFIGSGSFSVVVTCDVKACKNAADCAPADCPPDTGNGFGRKKRQADEGEFQQKLLAQMYLIRDPSAQEAQSGGAQSTSCIMKTEVTATIVALAVALLLVLILAIILFCVVLSRRRKEALYRDNTSVTTTTSSHAYANHLPTLVSEK